MKVRATVIKMCETSFVFADELLRRFSNLCPSSNVHNIHVHVYVYMNNVTVDMKSSSAMYYQERLCYKCTCKFTMHSSNLHVYKQKSHPQS